MKFRSLSYRLLGSYVVVIAALLSVFSVAMYWLFARSLYEDLDKQLITLANSATLSLGKKEHPQVDVDTDLNSRGLTLQWFAANGRLLATQGADGSSLPPEISGSVQQKGQLRELTIAVYEPDGRPPSKLKGYVRVSKSTLAVHELLEQMRWKMGVALLVELGISVIGGFWLTRQAVRPVERSLRQLKQFTADASHELRSPLTVIKSNIGLVLNHPERIHPSDARRLAAVNWAADQMTQLTEDLLFLARTDQNERVFTAKSLDLQPILKNLVELFEPQAQAKGITLTSELTIGLNLLGDAIQLNRLFSNLIENAIQYTPAGGQISVIARSQGKQIQVAVQDTGIGIAREDINKVFDRFWRTDQARAYRSGGYGLGLAIAKAIADQHEGKIDVKSELAQGTTFTVYLRRSF